jgi:hypothetical protein
MNIQAILSRLQIGFVFSNCFSNPQQCWGLNIIGFDWLCFSLPKTAQKTPNSP